MNRILNILFLLGAIVYGSVVVGRSIASGYLLFSLGLAAVIAATMPIVMKVEARWTARSERAKREAKRRRE
jgi:hypothetical protein